MNPIAEGRLTFRFDGAVSSEKYDEWNFYKSTMNQSLQPKGVDMAVVKTEALPQVTFLVEVKDFRVIDSPPKPSNLSQLPQTVALKVANTIGGLSRAANEASVPSELAFARLVQKTTSVRVVLHLEEHSGSSIALFPVNFRASVYQRLKQLVQQYDSNPLVLNLANTPKAGVPWAVS